MKMRKQKKGFTITELVIVIAVIAVLAAVLIPTFVSLVRRANESKDIQLVHNLNTALTIDGEKHNTMQDALDAALESGYDVDKINASATGNEILWDKVNDQFCYLKKDGNTKTIEYIPDSVREHEAKGADFWQICDKMPDTQEYSIYAGKNWTDEDGTVNVTVGFDAGKNDNITSVIYNGTTEARNIVIRTNGGNLEVHGYVDPSDNTKGDVISHYGTSGLIKVINCAEHSYHENGNVKDKLEVKQGHVVLADTAIVKTLALPNTSVTVDVGNGAKVGSYEVSNLDQLKGIQTDDMIVRESDGIITVTTSNDTSSLLFSAGNGTQGDPFIVRNLEDWKNIAWLSDCRFGYTNGGDEVVEIKYHESGKTYYVKLDVKELDIEQDTFWSSYWQYGTSSAMNIVIDFNGAVIKSTNKTMEMTFRGQIEYIGDEVYDPNFDVIYGNPYYLGDCYDRAYNVTLKNARFEGVQIRSENGINLTIENCTFSYSSDTQAIQQYISNNNYRIDKNLKSVLTVKNCTFIHGFIQIENNYSGEYGISEANIQNCDFTLLDTSMKWKAPVRFANSQNGTYVISGSMCNGKEIQADGSI